MDLRDLRRVNSSFAYKAVGNIQLQFLSKQLGCCELLEHRRGECKPLCPEYPG
ncbi:hypothetical protein D3C81_2234140 [compost metagenome]